MAADPRRASPGPQAPRPLRYAEIEPPPALAEHVLSCWTFEARGDAPILHHVWPDGCVSISVSLPAPGDAATPVAVLIGPTAEARRVPVAPGARYRGARFWPDAGGAVLGLSAEALRDRSAPAADSLGAAPAARLAREVAAAADERAAAAVFARALAPLVRAAPPLDPAVRRAVLATVAARGETPIARLASDVGLAPRQLQRRFRRVVGLTPKEYARVRRLRSALARLLEGERPAGWSRLAAEFGFADQSHLIRDFAEATGFTPQALEARLGMIEHEAVRP